MIAPYWVTRNARTFGESTVQYRWAISHVGDGVVCWTDDVNFAYRVVDLLNQQELTVKGKPIEVRS
jgi:hypothetical protein